MALQLDRMTYEEVEAYLQSGPGIAILPSGATEQHGVHGAIGTDTFAAMVVAERVAAVEARQPGGPHILTMGYQDANKGRLREVLGEWAREITPADVTYGSDGHGGALECSLGMVHCPEGYRPDRLASPDRSLVDARRSLSFTAAQYIERY